MNEQWRTWYAIQDKFTGMCLPEMGSRKGKGGYTNDMPDDSYPPRLFRHSKHAFDALRWWLAGVARENWSQSQSDGAWQNDGIVSEPRTDRKAEDMRVIQVRITMPSKGE